jgi:hypothetical protein
MEAIYSSEMLVLTSQTTQCHQLEDSPTSDLSHGDYRVTEERPKGSQEQNLSSNLVLMLAEGCT